MYITEIKIDRQWPSEIKILTRALYDFQKRLFNFECIPLYSKHSMYLVFDRDFTSWCQELLFFLTLHLLFPIFIWTFIFPFLFGLLFSFSIWTFISLFYLDFFKIIFQLFFQLFFHFFFSSSQFLFNFFFFSIAVTFWISSKFFLIIMHQNSCLQSRVK